jgi:hypothetical protein
MFTSASSEEMKAGPEEAVNAVPSSLKVATTKNGDVILVPQPSDDPEDPLVSLIFPKLFRQMSQK